MLIACGFCGRESEKYAGHVNRASRLGLSVYCDRACAGRARRRHVDPEEKKRRKSDYDAKRRAARAAALGVEALKAERAEWYRRNRNPEKERAFRKKRMPKHVEYCRRPEYRAKKHDYDTERTNAMYGEFAEAFRLYMELKKEIIARVPDSYERLKARGYYDRTAQQRRRDAGNARR